MPISLERALRHKEEWSRNLQNWRDRSVWPASLFHVCQLEVAAEILRSGKILSRNMVPNIICDVANQGALWNNRDAHDFVRLYFRPKTWIHIKTEGVKSTADPYRVDPHMSIPVAFVFDFVRVACLPNTFFVPGNFARTGAEPITGDERFDELDFSLIYDEGALTRDRITEVNNWRMSEVVVRDELELDLLSAVVCRTVHEERTLRYLVGGNVGHKITVEQRGSIFVRKGIFIDELFWQGKFLHLSFHGPIAGVKPLYSVKISWLTGNALIEKSYELRPGKYRFEDIAASEGTDWRIDIEGCLMFLGVVPSAEGLITN